MDWIPLDDDYPCPGQMVLVCDQHDDWVILGCWRPDKDCFETVTIGSTPVDSLVTHWMPLPDPVKLKEDDELA